MKRNCFFTGRLSVACFLLSLQISTAQDVSLFMIAKGQAFAQTGTNVALPSSEAP